MFDANTISYQLYSSVSINEGIWQHWAVTFDGLQMRFYINANLVRTGAVISYSMPLGLIRTQNFIGSTSCGSNGYSSSLIDDLKMFNISLSQSQINDVMVSNETNFNYLKCASGNFDFFLKYFL
jgi:hypothetical protein